MTYANIEDLMELTQDLFNHVLAEVLGKNIIVYQNQTIDFAPPWPRIAMVDALTGTAGMPKEAWKDIQAATAFARSKDIVPTKDDNLGKILAKIFDQLVEPQLIRPTFVYGYPIEISPLSRRNDQDPELADRFELFIGGKEIANAFNELNDPLDQRERFKAQASLREAGDEEAQYMDEEYLDAMEYGLPPTAGEGIGIDRVVMLLTDSPSIRDVIFFPHMRTK